MKEISEQLALFGGATLPISTVRAVKVVPSYAVEKDDDGKTVKDEDGDAVLKRDAQGNLVITAETIKLQSRSAKFPKGHAQAGELKPDCLQAVTGLKGQALMQFEREARGALAQGRLAEFTKLIASGQFTFATARNSANGAKSFVIKPIFGGKSITAADDNELLEEMKRRGFKVEADPTHSNGSGKPAELPEETGEGKNTPAAPEAAKPRETAAQRKARKNAEAEALKLAAKP